MEKVLNENLEVIEELIIGMKESKTYVIYLSEIDEHINQGNQFVIDNEKKLRDFRNNSKMDILRFSAGANTCDIYQKIPAHRKVVSLVLFGIVHENNNITWKVSNSSNKDYLSLNIYNFLYNSD